MRVGPKVHFKKAKLPSKKKLIGKYCFLEPINVKQHSKDLFNNFSKDGSSFALEDVDNFTVGYNTTLDCSN